MSAPSVHQRRAVADWWTRQMASYDAAHPVTFSSGKFSAPPGWKSAPPPPRRLREAMTPDRRQALAAAWTQMMTSYDAEHPLTFSSGHTFTPLRESLVRQPGTLSLLREYSPDQPRDEHGRWTSGGSGDSPLVTQTVGGIPITHFGDASVWTDGQRAEVLKALGDAVAANPKLASGEYPIKAVCFLSGGRPAGVDPKEWKAYSATASRAVAMTTRFSDGTRILVNDLAPVGKSGMVAASSNTAYGAMMHEVGHSFYAQGGIWSNAEAGQVLTRYGLTPFDMGKVSVYAATSPAEALGELYGMSHTPGFSLPPAVAEPYASVEAAVALRGPDLLGTKPGGGDASFLGKGRALILLNDDPAIVMSAQRNIAAKAWVDIPAVFRELYGPMRESYSAGEARDDHGRWTSGGGSGDGGALATSARKHRNRKATKEHKPTASQVLGSHLVLADGKTWQVKAMLADLNKLPPALAAKLVAAGVVVYLGNRPVVDMAPWLKALPPGEGYSSWSQVAGVTSVDHVPPTVVVGNGLSDSISVTLHEAGHALGGLPGISGSGAAPLDSTSAWRAIQAADYPKLNPYFQQGGPGGALGSKELFAEAFAATMIDEHGARVSYGAPAINYIKNGLGL